MLPTGKIPVQAWMAASATRSVIAALTADGAEARFVGGCVRDSILKRPVEDVDIATPEPPERVMELLERAGLGAIPSGIEHGTVTAEAGGDHFQITTLRRDVETDGRRARVAFTDDWKADAARRDFTINTLSCTPDGDIYDPFGGLDDLSHGMVRFVGNARQRIDEDLLRILRYFRFYAVCGRPPPDIDALAACRAAAHRVLELSAERLRGELLRILIAPNPADVLVLMRGERVLDHLLPEAGDVGRMRMLSWLETSAIRMDSVAPDGLRRLAALLHTDAAGTDAVAARFRLSKAEAERLLSMTAPSEAVDADMDEAARRRVLRRLGAQTVRDLALLAWAGELAIDPRQPGARKPNWQDLLAAAEAWTPPEFPLKGEDVLALGVPAGPRVGRLLGAVEGWWEEGGCKAGRAACLEALETMAREER